MDEQRNTGAGSRKLSPMNTSENDPVGEKSEPTPAHQRSISDSRAGSPFEDSPDSDSNAKAHLPIQKRRRVTRACDECRRKKIKCDGKQPCTHCTVYSYECTYDQPSNRRRNPAPQYIEALEQRLQKAESIIRTVLPGVDLEDPKYDARGVDQIIEISKNLTNLTNLTNSKSTTAVSKSDDEGQMKSMVDRTGSLDLDDQGNWDFHGHSSGYAFMRRFRAQFGEQLLPDPRIPIKSHSISQILDSPKSAYSSPYDFNPVSNTDLPSREVAIELCRNTLDDCCALMRPLHRPTFFRRLHAIYDTDPEQYTNNHIRFLPLLYVVMAVGCLFSLTEHENSMLDLKGYKEAIEQGYQYFSSGKQMLEITDCRDLLTLQAIFFMIIFLQCSAKLATCYAYVGIALRACCRLGLHRNLPNNFNTIEREERKRMFWLIRRIDTYVGAMLGLPQMLSDDDIDQELPLEVHDDYIHKQGVQPMPPGIFPLLKATNAHTKLTGILHKVVRYIYPIKGPGNLPSTDGYTISHARIRELERDLQNWMDHLPMELRPSDNSDKELSRVQQLLRISYGHVQMTMYRPFIHYVAQACQNQGVDKRSFACAAACVSVSRNVVHITSEMKRRGLLVGAYWFVMYTTYFAILSLVFFVLENPESPTGKDILRDAMEGRDTLASLATRSIAADRCTMSLISLFNELPDKLKERRSSLHATLTTSRKRPPPSTETANPPLNQSAPNITTPNNALDHVVTTNKVKSLPDEFLAKIAKRNSMPNPAPGVNVADHLSQDSPSHGHTSTITTSPMPAQLDYGSMMAAGQIPDLKNVMFPSDNPFAYPNQPISTLESSDSQYGYQDPSLDSFSGTNNNSVFSTPASMNLNPIPQPQALHGREYDLFHGSFDDRSRMATQFSPAGGHPSTTFSNIAATGLGSQDQDFDMLSMQDAAGAGESARHLSQADYWSHMNKNNLGPRLDYMSNTNVSLDELFGGDGWGTGWPDPTFSSQ